MLSTKIAYGVIHFFNISSNILHVLCRLQNDLFSLNNLWEIS